MADENFGYGAVDQVVKETSGTGKYLNFRKGDKGRVITIRVASEPVYVLQHWTPDVTGKQTPIDCTGEECPYCGKDVKDKLQKVAKWAWIVIDREDGDVKVFTGPTQIARALNDLSKLKNREGKLSWGDPRTFDVSIERTEVAPNYYKIEPDPDSRRPLTDEESAKVEAANFDLMAELKGSKKSDNTGNYGTHDLETAPDGEESANVPTGAEDVNPDDIPF